MSVMMMNVEAWSVVSVRAIKEVRPWPTNIHSLPNIVTLCIFSLIKGYLEM